MTFNFPNSPGIGQSYTPASGLTFVWDGIAWKGVSQGAPAIVSIGDTPPSSPSPGQLWFESDTGSLFVRYVDVDSSQWVETTSSPRAATETVIYDTAVGMATTGVPDYVAAFRTNGYSAVGDGGAALYKRAISEPAHAGKIQTLDGAWWELSESVVTMEMFGALGLNVTADGTALTNAIGYLNAIGGGTIRCKANRVYHIHLVGGSPGVPVTAPLRIDLNGATWKRPDASMFSDFKRMVTLSMDTATATFELFGGIVDANHRGNLPSPPGGSDWNHNASIFVLLNIAGIPSVYFHDLKLLDRWNYDHLAIYGVTPNSLIRATFERITSETAQTLSLRADIIWNYRSFNIDISNCTVHRMESEPPATFTAPVNLRIRDSQILQMLDIGGFGDATSINFYNCYFENVVTPSFNFIRANLYDRHCDFGHVDSISPAIWRSFESKFLVEDTGFPIGNAGTHVGVHVSLDWYLTRPKFRLLAGPQTVGNPAILFPAIVPVTHQPTSITFEEPDFLDDFGYGCNPYGKVRFIRPKWKSLGTGVYVVGGAAGRICDITVDGGDYSQCTATPVRLNSFNTAGYKLTLLGDWFGTEGRWSSAGSAHAPANIENHRRIFHTANPDSAIIGDRLFIQPVPTAGVLTRVAGTSAVSAQTWRVDTWITAKAVTASRPTLTASDIGVMHLDTTLDADGKPVWWTGTAWVDATGAVV